MGKYARIAPYYDRFKNESFYKIVLNYLVNKIIPLENTKLLDIGTGTGFFPLYYARKGIECIGIDHSRQMINIARNSAEKQGLNNIKFIEKDFLKYNTNEKFDYVIMFFDVINHITEPKNITLLFNKVYSSMNKGGYFFFDILTMWGMSKAWGNDKFYEYYDNFKILWRSNWNNKKRLLTVNMKIISDKEEIKETVVERGYEKQYLEEKLIEIGFKIKGSYPFFFHKNHPGRYIIWVEKAGDE